MITTAQILAERALQFTCGQQCIDWAMALLETGHDSTFIRRLAGESLPHNHFEIASLRDQILKEFGVFNISTNDAITLYSAELLEAASKDALDLDTAIIKVKEMCIANGYQSNIYDFYLLFYARSDLREQDFQYYYRDADRYNIEELTRTRIREFVVEQGNRRASAKTPSAEQK